MGAGGSGFQTQGTTLSGEGTDLFHVGSMRDWWVSSEDQWDKFTVQMRKNFLVLSMHIKPSLLRAHHHMA